jgi:EpsI family protein
MTSQFSKVAVTATIIMIVTAIAAFFWQPKRDAKKVTADFSLEIMVPKAFGEWRIDTSPMPQMVNPQAQEILDKIYSQILNRTYVNAAGQKVMLSIAYGSDQRGALAAHQPEVCYPAQGFIVKQSFASTLKLPIGNLNVNRMLAVKGNRSEPVSYWFTAGDRQVQTGLQRRMVDLKSLLTGQIPDGLLFRVSSFDKNPQAGYAIHNSFIDQMISSVGPRERLRLAGLFVQ